MCSQDLIDDWYFSAHLQGEWDSKQLFKTSILDCMTFLSWKISILNISEIWNCKLEILKT